LLNFKALIIKVWVADYVIFLNTLCDRMFCWWSCTSVPMTQMCGEHHFSTKTDNLPPQTLTPKCQGKPIWFAFFRVYFLIFSAV
jgi:hypothetical protein